MPQYEIYASSIYLEHEFRTEQTRRYPPWYSTADSVEQALEKYFELHSERFAERDFRLCIQEKHNPNIAHYIQEALKRKKEMHIKKKQEEILKLELELAKLKAGESDE